MSRVIITETAGRGLVHCREFLADKHPLAAKRAARAIKKAFVLLQSESKVGKPLDDSPELRELIIPFGESGYTTLYRIDTNSNSVIILAFRHQKETGY